MPLATSDQVIIDVIEVRGRCPVHKVGDSVVIEGAKIDLKKTDNICIHALPSLLHYVVAIREGINPITLGLSTDEKYAYIQCVDPGKPYTDGGTVIFRCYKSD
jgi:uncharacterized repeat protein (TIGR04076 family)